MITDKQISCLAHYIEIMGGYQDDLSEWYEAQPTHNTIHSNPEANYRNQIIQDRIKNSDYNLVSGLIGDLEKVVYMSGEVDIDNLIDRLNNLSK